MTKLTNDLIAEAHQVANEELLNSDYVAVKIYNFATRELACIIYFSDSEELVEFGSKLSYEPNQFNLLAANLYKMVNTSSDTRLQVAFASQQFMARLFVNRPDLIDGILITRPDLSESELLIDALINAAITEATSKPNEEFN